ncbi:MAG: hypothetical protein IMF10_09680 [Proteobacteria bacterium]|nr:hypothetical protein [Pseudomonadota bacterium]
MKPDISLRDLFKTPPFDQSLRQIQILILKILNVFLRLKSSSSLTLNKIEHFAKVSLRRPSIWTLLLIILLLSTGCYPIIKGWSQESFRHPEFSNGALNQEGLALLPVIILEGTYKKVEEPTGQIPPAPYAHTTLPADRGKGKTVITHDAYRIILSEILLSKIQTRRPSLRLISPTDALKRLNDEGLTDAYRKFSSDFPKVGFDDVLLKNFGKALNCRYLFIGQAVVTESKSEASITFVWSFGRKSVLRSVKISGQIWDTFTGRQVWEGFGVGYNTLSAYEKAPLIEEIANQAVDSLLKNIMP